MKKLLFTSLALCLISMLFAQVPETEWTRTFGGSGSESSSQMVENTDGDYFFACSSTSPPSEERTAPKKGSRDIWVVKTDKEGNKIWDKAYGAGSITVTSMAATSDGGFIVGVNTNSGKAIDKTDTSRGGLDVWLIKIDRNGNKVWDKTLGGSDDDFLGEIIITQDGSILVAINTSSPISGDKTVPGFGGSDCWVIKINSNGQKIWDKGFGGSGGDSFYTGLVDKEGNYIFGGTSFSPVSGTKTEPSRGGNDGWLVKTDANGNKIWDKTLGGDQLDYIQTMALTKEGNYVLGLASESGISGDKTVIKIGGLDCWILEINQAGNTVWQKNYGGDKSDYLYSISSDDNNCLYLGIGSNSGISGDKNSPFSGVSYDAWIIKTSDNGDILWQSSYPFSSLDNSKLTSDNDYVITGTKDGMRIIKLDNSIITRTNFKSINELKIYPNPSKDWINIQINELSENSVCEIEVVSIDGKLIVKNSLQINNGVGVQKFDLLDGIYILKINCNKKNYTHVLIIKK